MPRRTFPNSVEALAKVIEPPIELQICDPQAAVWDTPTPISDPMMSVSPDCLY